MVFQNKLNVVKYFLFFITCLLSLNLSLNASAIETYVSSTNPSKITYIFRNDDGVETNQTITLQTGFTGNIYFNPNSLKFQSMKRLNIELSASRQFSKTQRFKLKYYAKVHYEDNYSDTLMSVFNCPDGVNGFRIYYCDIQQLSQSQVINEIRQYPDANNQQYPFFYTTSTSNDIYYVVELKGYYNSDSLTSKTLIETDQHFFLIRNNGSSNLTPLVQLNFYFTTIEIFKEEDSAEEEVAEKELESTTNIENQTPQNSSGGSSENQQTTNLIGVFSGFLSQLQSFSATNCNLDLPFPAFIGGTQTVNICQGKDVLGNFITIVGTLAMLTFYIPLAFVLLKMIYNEIRSFTNG